MDSSRSHRRYVVVTPVRNEVRFIGETISSMALQTVLPLRWVIVDDGSTDGTMKLLEQAAVRYSWITVVRRADRGFRKAGGGVVEAFYDGYAALQDSDWDFVVKLDGDLSFTPEYFEKCLERFARDPRLGIGGGTVCVMQDGELKVDSPGDPPFHVRGATKIYRSACWKQIHPLVAAPGWDTIDEVSANMHGWRTGTFTDIPLMQQRETGAVAGTWPNWVKNGLANYITGYHPVFMLAKCVMRLWRKPWLIGAAGLWAGFCSGYFKRPAHTADAATARYLRRQQMLFLLRRPSIYR